MYGDDKDIRSGLEKQILRVVWHTPRGYINRFTMISAGLGVTLEFFRMSDKLTSKYME